MHNRFQPFVSNCLFNELEKKYIIIIRTIFTIFLLFTWVGGSAQFLGETGWDSEEEFRSVEDKIIENIIWLEENPFATESNDTKAITQYVLDWLTETPYVSVTLDEVFTDGVTNNKKYKYADKLVITYLFGKSVYVIQNPEDNSQVNASTRGVIGMVKVYEELIKSDLKAYSRTMETYQNLYQNGNLEEYVRIKLEELGI
ncbi:MAG: hypothetical protein HKN67_14385 [Saprospiraceae bacterium]|nr:hypothetical protein [Saprospiraceae bacterium]